ncbi:type III-A CRISPR-associated RAMP protein Csm5 [Clostridium botulinum]|uniref:type III-A CRISPR-associated RAMP protein Csm5 n=1 Tax=Clostridium botulinum TaxID=1491 RepID=UPI0013FA893C|nr:type III-A CRISPR-associated RAMP protein Csm5 [Clostridium botulinum]NFB58728.1 type III-A CRISPR-associated RAMP protein Csm5 [Clostridium botulinum]HDK7159186.1 type III-A CRISPR-associated RAMP protein Csm5 [Clostridium botulinum]HDK7215895.1 type III-A CRISPR-associated RAMP protein Csm5 [Clostridium botulinum]
MNYDKIILNLKGQVLTPVHIGCGKKYSPYLDIIKNENKITVLDEEKIIEKLVLNDEIFEEYINILKNKSPNAIEKYNIINILKNNKIEIGEVKKYDLICGNSFNNLIDVNQSIKTKGIPYIPGSSIKGSIRTALIYNKLLKNGIDFGKIKEISNLKNKYYCYLGQDIFRQNDKLIYDDIMKNLLVRDTDIISNNEVKVYLCRAINLYESIKNGNISTSVKSLNECIQKDTKITFSIIIKNSLISKEELYNNINNFYEKILLKEIQEIEKLKLNVIISQYKLLLNEINEFRKYNNGFILRIGGMKGIFSNTIDSILSEKELEYIRNAHKNKRKKTGEFPTTKWCVMDEYENIQTTLGWIKIMEE